MLIEIPNVGRFESTGIIGISTEYFRIPTRKIKHIIKNNKENSYNNEDHNIEYTDHIDKYSATIIYSNGNRITLYSDYSDLYKRIKSYVENVKILSKPSKIVTLSTGNQIQVDYIKDISIYESMESVSYGQFQGHSEKRYYLDIKYLDPEYSIFITYKSKEDLDKDLALLEK